jgi:hypothetical protein
LLFTLLQQGGATKAQEASYIYDELIDKYGSFPQLLNGLAVAKMHQGQWDEAETALKEAIAKVRRRFRTALNSQTVLSSGCVWTYYCCWKPLCQTYQLPPLNTTCRAKQASSDPDTLANLVVASYHLQRPQDVINRFLR